MDTPETNEHPKDADQNVEQLPAAVERLRPAINDSAGSEHCAKRKKEWPQRIEAVCAVLLVIITGFYTYYAAGQLHKMRRATKAAEDSANAAKRAADTANQSMQLDQRAWVGPVEAALPPYDDGGRKVYIKIGEKPKFSFVLANSGKTPALKLTFKITNHVYRSTEPFVPYYETPKTKTTVGTLFPGGRMSIPTLETPGVAERFHVTSFASGEYIDYVYGEISYEDIFGQPHKTEFCTYVDQTLTQLFSCATYNYAD